MNILLFCDVVLFFCFIKEILGRRGIVDLFRVKFGMVIFIEFL